MSNIIGLTVLAEKIAETQGLTKKHAKEIIDAVFAEVKTQVSEGNSVRVKDFGTFKAKHRPARKARNPRTGETIQVPAKSSIGFSGREI